MTSARAVPANPTIAVVALCFGGLTAALTQTMVIPIQSELPQLLSTSASNAGWVITATLLAAAVSMPVAGRLADLYGKQRVLVVNAALLVVGTVVCALSSTIVPMLAGRALQGFAMGFIPVGISLMREFTPPHMTSTAIAAMSATLGVGGAIGLPLAAWIADGHPWHLLFWVSAGLGLLVLLATVVLVPHIHDAQPGHVDVVGMLGLALGLVTFLVGVSKGNDWGWSSGRTWGAIVGGVPGGLAAAAQRVGDAVDVGLLGDRLDRVVDRLLVLGVGQRPGGMLKTIGLAPFCCGGNFSCRRSLASWLPVPGRERSLLVRAPTIRTAPMIMTSITNPDAEHDQGSASTQHAEPMQQSCHWNSPRSRRQSPTPCPGVKVTGSVPPEHGEHPARLGQPPAPPPFSSGNWSSRHSPSELCPDPARSLSRALSSTRRILPEMVLGRSKNSSRRTRR